MFFIKITDISFNPKTQYYTQKYISIFQNMGKTPVKNQCRRFLHIKGLVHPKMKMCCSFTNPWAIRYVDEFFFGRYIILAQTVVLDESAQKNNVVNNVQCFGKIDCFNL